MLQWLMNFCLGIVNITGVIAVNILNTFSVIMTHGQKLIADYKLDSILKTIRDITPVTKETTVQLYDAQIEMEKLFDKNQLHKRIKTEFMSADADFREKFRGADIEPKFGYDLLVQMQLHKRVDLPTLVGLLRKNYQGNCQLTADAILRAAKADLVDYDPRFDIFIVRKSLTGDVLEEIEMYQYPLPMLVEPKELKDNRDTGYLTRKDSVILKKNHHDEDVCLDVLNKLNRTKLRMNMNIVAFIQNSWRNLDKPKPDETRDDFKKRQRAFAKYDATAKDVAAHLAITGGEFYLTHKYDKRGRIYCQGYHVTYQGNTWNKACIEFAKGETLD